jgi:F-type H+-transporting ATPase subunit a
MAPIMLPIELISHVSRVMSLSLRLFGNIFGEELVIAVLFSLIPFFVPLPMMFLGLITGGLQAFIFTLLTTIYLAGAVAIEHHDEHEAHDAPHDDRVDVGRGHAAATA